MARSFVDPAWSSLATLAAVSPRPLLSTRVGVRIHFLSGYATSGLAADPTDDGTLLRLTSSYPMRPALNGMLKVGMDAPGDFTEGSRHQWRLDRMTKFIQGAA